MSRKINHIMAGDKMSNSYLNALIGANYMLTDLHINSDFICEKEILKGSLKGYKTLILPCTYVISEECAAKIAEFVESGGHVIADYILAEKRPGGVCYTALPGAGLDKVFGIEREDVLYIAHPTMERENPLGINTGTTVEQVLLMGAESVCGEYMEDFPMVTVNRYGSGTATYIATQYFSKYVTRPTEALRQVLAEMLLKNGIAPYASLEAEDKKAQSALITCALHGAEGLNIVTVTNTDYEPITDRLILSKGDYTFIEEKEGFSITHTEENTIIEFTLGALETFATTACRCTHTHTKNR